MYVVKKIEYIHADLILDQEYNSILFGDTCIAYKGKVTYKEGSDSLRNFVAHTLSMPRVVRIIKAQVHK